MPRRLRYASGGLVYHVLNRAVGRATIFDKTGDYAAFEKVLRQARNWLPMRVLAYCAMPNHWHLVVWPGKEKVSGTLLSAANRGRAGAGHRHAPSERDSEGPGTNKGS